MLHSSAPCGAKTRAASVNAAILSGTNITPNWQAIRSTDASGTGRSSASATCQFASGSRCADQDTIAGLKSVAVTRAPGSAATSARVRAPVPAATSNTVAGASAAARCARCAAYGVNSAGTKKCS